MAEQTFKSPGFFEREIDLSVRDQEIVGVPAGVIGTTEMGPAFVPVTVGSFSDFVRRFGDLNVNIQDVILTINIIIGTSDFIQEADLNFDGVIDVLDIVLIVNIILYPN